MLGTGQIQDRVIDGYEEISSASAKSPGQRRFAEKLDDVVTHELPEFSGRNPDIAFTADDFC